MSDAELLAAFELLMRGPAPAAAASAAPAPSLPWSPRSPGTSPSPDPSAAGTAPLWPWRWAPGQQQGLPGPPARPLLPWLGALRDARQSPSPGFAGGSQAEAGSERGGGGGGAGSTASVDAGGGTAPGGAAGGRRDVEPREEAGLMPAPNPLPGSSAPSRSTPSSARGSDAAPAAGSTAQEPQGQNPGINPGSRAGPGGRAESQAAVNPQKAPEGSTPAPAAPALPAEGTAPDSSFEGEDESGSEGDRTAALLRASGANVPPGRREAASALERGAGEGSKTESAGALLLQGSCAQCWEGPVVSGKVQGGTGAPAQRWRGPSADHLVLLCCGPPCWGFWRACRSMAQASTARIVQIESARLPTRGNRLSYGMLGVSFACSYHGGTLRTPSCGDQCNETVP